MNNIRKLYASLSNLKKGLSREYVTTRNRRERVRFFQMRVSKLGLLMRASRNTRILQSIAHSAFGCLVLGALTYTSYRLHLNLATAGFLCLIVVVLPSFFGNMMSATILSVVAVAWLDYFFAPPILSLRISDPLNVLALATFLTTTLAITYLITRVRREKQASELQRKEMKRLYELARQLLALTPEEIDPPRLLTLFRDVFALRAVCLFENETAISYIVGDPHYDLEARTRIGYLAGEDRDDVLCRTSVRCLRVAGQPIGALGFEWPDHQEFTPDSLSALETAMLERVRAFHAATQAAAAAQAERLRTMVLDALAHAVKTPLATVLAAIGGLRETGALESDHLEFVDVIEAETARLGSLTTRLLRMATLDGKEVRPRLQRVDVSRLVAEELNLMSRQFADHKLSLVQDGDRADAIVSVVADPELLRLALSQLIENACKYSQPSSNVDVSAYANEGSVAIRVRNCGYIPTEEQSKIFDRFYRGKQSRDSTAGTGLGLDIARRIALAHGGTLALEDSGRDGSTFRITLPVAVKEC
jgi:two-component system sensor histidine kinase KdpD